MALRDNELARRNGLESTLELRSHPLRARWLLDDLLTADSNTLRCVFTCSIRALPDATEREALEEVLMGTRVSVTVADVVAHFTPSIRSTAMDAARSKEAKAWLAPGGGDALVAGLKKSVLAVAFSCGLEILPPYEIELESPSYQQQITREMHRALAEKQAAGQVEHVARAAELLRKFQDLRQAAPDLPPGRILEQLSPSDQGQMLQTLLLASAGEQSNTDLWAVAGPYLVRINGEAESPRPALIPLPPTLGPLRSVQPAEIEGRRVLLVGARSGFMVVDPDHLDEPQSYADPAVESQLGFSRVVFHDVPDGEGPIFAACHGEAGIVRWSLGRTVGPISSVRPDRFMRHAPPPPAPSVPSAILNSQSVIGSHTPGPRNLQVLDSHRLIFSVGNHLWVLEGKEATKLQSESDGEIIAIAPDETALHIIHEDGTMYRVDHSTLRTTEHQRRGGRYRSAGVLPWLGGTRLLLAAEHGAVECLGSDDPLVTQYVSPYRGLRVITGSAALVAGISPDRQRLILWRTLEGRQPLSEIYLTSMTRHRIADLEFA